MKIPSAYFDGSLGQRVAQPAPVLRLDPSGDVAVGQAAERLGQNVLQVAVNQNEFQGQQDLQAAHEFKTEVDRQQREQESERKHLQDLRNTSEAKASYLDFDNKLSAAHQEIIDNPDIPPEDYPQKLRETAGTLKNEIRGKLNEVQWLNISNDLDHRTNKGSEMIFKAGQTEINDQVWANDLAAADALVNDPTRTSRDKITILKDENFFAETGRTAAEIEIEREKRIAKVTETDVQGRFNQEGPAVTKAFLEAKNEDGTFSNLPELHMDKRDAYVAHADEKIKQLEAEARREARERKTLQDQQTHNLFESMKTMLNDGYPLPANVDVQMRMAFKGSKYEPLYAAIKEKANSLEFKTDLINKDPLLYFARSNGYNITPLDMTNPATIPQQMAQRIQFSTMAQKALNLPYRPDFLFGEQKAIGQQLEMLDGPNRVKSVKIWSDILGSQNMTQFAKQVSGIHSNDSAKNTALALEIALAANGRDTAAQWVATGRDYQKTAKLTEPARKAQNNAFETLAGNALAGLPQMRDDYKNAVNAAFIYLAKTQGMAVETETGFSMPGTFSSGSDAGKLYNQAFRAVVGDTTKINNKTTILPPGMTDDRFKNSIKRITPEIVIAAGGAKGLAPEKAAELLRSEASLWESGEGVYSFQIRGKQVKTNDGKPFKLRFSP